MDLTNLLMDIGKMSRLSFYDSLLKVMKHDYHYVMGFKKNENSWVVEIQEVKGKSEDIPKRIRLYDQPSASKLGCSFSVKSFVGRESICKILRELSDLSSDIVEIVDYLEKDMIEYVENDEELIERWKVVKNLYGYMTIMINGKYVVDLPNYDEYIVKKLYKEMRKKIDEDDRCTLCGSDKELIQGGIKEPGWKFLSTTRVSNLSSSGKAFVRCMSCEQNVMKGFKEVQSLVKQDHTKTTNFQRIIIPVTTDRRLWEQLKRLRKDYDSDIYYYEAIERLLERFNHRGVEEFIDLRIVKNQRSYGVVSTKIVYIEDLLNLQKKRLFEKWLLQERYVTKTELTYYPLELVESKDDYKWKYIDRVKRYWLGYEDVIVFDEIEKRLKLDVGYLTVYKLWREFSRVGGEVLKEKLEETRAYCMGRLLSMGILLQRQDMDNKSGLTSLERRFRGYPKNMDYMFNEVMKVIGYRKRFLKKELKEELTELLSMYRNADEGDSVSYYIGLHKTI